MPDLWTEMSTQLVVSSAIFLCVVTGISIGWFIIFLIIFLLDIKLIADKRGTIPDKISIHDRPKEVEERFLPGYWEGYFIVSKNHKSALVL